MVKIIDKTKNIYLDNIIFFIFYFLLLVAIISTYLFVSNLVHGKFMILFSEPSHFALVYAPILLYVCYNEYINNKKFNVFIYLLITFLVAITIQNSTILLSIFIVILLLYSGRLIFLIALLSIIIIFTFDIGSDYFVDRISLSSESTNASALVFLSGWERGYLSLVDSFGFGVGFQQMGIVGPMGTIMESMARLGLGKSNYNDGGTLGAKLIAELGVFGLLIILAYLRLLFFAVRKIIRKEIYNKKSVFFCAIIIMMSLTFFVRSAGYFTPMTFMFGASIYWLLSNDNYKKLLK